VCICYPTCKISFVLQYLLRKFLSTDHISHFWHVGQQKRKAFSLADIPPINITNVLPSQTSTLSTESVPSKPSSPLEILGQLNVAVRKYSEWQYSRVTSKSLKIEYQKAYNITLAEGLDLELVYEEQNAQFYIDKGIKSGIAQRFVCDIKKWAKQYNIA
jgi:hypothetical protein